MQESIDKWVEELLKIHDDEHKMTDKQIRIIKAAVETFSEKGYAATSTSEIAQKAGVAEGTIFRHFKTKKELLLSIVAPTMVKLIGPFLMRDFTKVIDIPYESYEDFIRAVLRNRLEFAKNNLKILKVLIQEIPFQEDLKRDFKEKITDHIFAKLEKVISHYKQKGSLVDIPTRSILRFTISSGIGMIFAMLILAPESNWDEEEEIELTIRMIMYGLAFRPDSVS